MNKSRETSMINGTTHKNMTVSEFHCAAAPPRAVALWRASANLWRSAV